MAMEMRRTVIVRDFAVDIFVSRFPSYEREGMGMYLSLPFCVFRVDWLFGNEACSIDDSLEDVGIVRQGCGME